MQKDDKEEEKKRDGKEDEERIRSGGEGTLVCKTYLRRHDGCDG